MQTSTVLLGLLAWRWTMLRDVAGCCRLYWGIAVVGCGCGRGRGCCCRCRYWCWWRSCWSCWSSSSSSSSSCWWWWWWWWLLVVVVLVLALALVLLVVLVVVVLLLPLLRLLLLPSSVLSLFLSTCGHKHILRVGCLIYSHTHTHAKSFDFNSGLQSLGPGVVRRSFFCRAQRAERSRNLDPWDFGTVFCGWFAKCEYLGWILSFSVSPSVNNLETGVTTARFFRWASLLGIISGKRSLQQRRLPGYRLQARIWLPKGVVQHQGGRNKICYIICYVYSLFITLYIDFTLSLRALLPLNYEW